MPILLQNIQNCYSNIIVILSGAKNLSRHTRILRSAQNDNRKRRQGCLWSYGVAVAVGVPPVVVGAVRPLVEGTSLCNIHEG